MITTTRFFIGIDVSKPFFDASLMVVVDHVKQTVETAKFDNSIAGMKLFEKWLKLHKVTMNEHSMVVIENTGIYHRLLWAFCSKNISLFTSVMQHISNGALVLLEEKMIR